MAKRIKGIGLSVKMNYDPVVEDRNTTGATLISIQRFREYLNQPAGLITKDEEPYEYVGCCIESSAEVLKIVFPQYRVLEFNGYSFFSGEDFEMMEGLSIERINSSENVKKTLSELLSLNELVKLRRDVSSEELEKIRAHFTGEDHLGVGNPRLFRKLLSKDGKQRHFDEQEILRLIGIAK